MKLKVNADVGVIVGRFQVPELHSAHKDLFNFVRRRHARVIVVLGVSAAVGTKNNPLDFSARKQMITELYPDIDVVYIKDRKSDVEWSQQLDQIVSDLIGPGKTPVLYGSRGSFVSAYSGKFKTELLEADRIISGTEVRLRTSERAKPSADFRAGAIWQAYNQYDRVYPTVDVAVFLGDRLLLAKKPGEQRYRFVGGFADPNSERYEDDAYREVKEETGLNVVCATYIASTTIDDWRYRGERDKIKTMLFAAKFIAAQTAAPADDIVEVRWFPYDQVKADTLESEHRYLLYLLDRWKALNKEYFK